MDLGRAVDVWAAKPCCNDWYCHCPGSLSSVFLCLKLVAYYLETNGGKPACSSGGVVGMHWRTPELHCFIFLVAKSDS